MIESIHPKVKQCFLGNLTRNLWGANMNIISLYYFSELAKDLHITRTANRLYISQQTLSNHIQRLEEYYGVPLLYRKPSLSLTCAGEYVLSFARLILKENRNLKDILCDIAQQERGSLRIGASSLRLNACLPHILPKFLQRYPHIELRLTDSISSKLEPMILTSELDFAIILANDRQAQISYHHLMDDYIYLCVSEDLLDTYYPDEKDRIKAKGLRGITVSDVARLPFCTLSNRMGLRIQACFDEEGITPYAPFSSTNIQASSTIGFQRFAACFATQMHLVDQQSRIPDNMNIMPLHLHGVPLTQQLEIACLKDRYIPHYAEFFLNLVSQYFSEVEQIHIERIVP